jgi:hypothetical protein
MTEPQINFKTMNDFNDYMTIYAEHQVLKYAASKQQFCPVTKCGRILDYRKIVMITFKSGMVITMCSKCFESENVKAQMLKFADQVKEITKFRKK